jgi:hypothetical protein
MEWSPELHGQTHAEVAQAGAATVIKAESIISDLLDRTRKVRLALNPVAITDRFFV